MNIHDKTYHDFLRKILSEGEIKQDRTNTGTISIFGPQCEYDLSQGFPLITTKKVHWKSIVGELLWMLEGNTSAKDLKDKYGVTIWDEWAKDNGDLGPVYGSQWRSWEGHDVIRKCGYDTHECTYHFIDQIDNVISSIKKTPHSRRHIVSAWNVAELSQMALPPCHAFFQFYVRGDKLDCKLYQRSGDAFLGVPFNIASYSLLTHMVAQVTGHKPGKFIHTFGDAHIYANHMDAVNEQLNRTSFKAPEIKLNNLIKDIDDFTVNDIELIDYVSHGKINAPVAR